MSTFQPERSRVEYQRGQFHVRRTAERGIRGSPSRLESFCPRVGGDYKPRPMLANNLNTPDFAAKRSPIICATNPDSEVNDDMR